VDWTLPPEVECFRAEVRGWLERELPADLRGATLALDAGAEQIGRLRAWNQRLADAGYAAISWPVAYGGRGAGPLEQMVLAEEMDRAQAPPPLNPIGLANIAPSIMQWGSEEQKRGLLPRMLRGDDIWCQGFSEPGAGSDLASLRTTAVSEGDHFSVTGQKVWNTLGQHADWCELLVRTRPDAPKHAGISCLLVDMKLPGIEVRPLTTITGGNEFAEIFFDAVPVPKAALLGPEGRGWQVAMTTLTHERASVAALHLGVRRKLRRLIEDARTTLRGGRPAAEDPLVRQALARCYLEGEVLRFLSDRAIAGALHGRPPGPEGSLAKLAWSDVENRIACAAGLVFGPTANSGRWGAERVNVRSTSIAGGTTQVNKNILAHRVLGLPRAT
jgi:alkylation response protein AidB-like acyl-CoA dehydrogenase